MIDLSVNREKYDYWQTLLEWLEKNNLPTEKIREAYLLAEKFYEGKKRGSGEDFISHPVWIAGLIAQLGIGEEAVIAALFHEMVSEDEGISVDEIANKFGDETALLAEGLREVRKKTDGIELHKNNVEFFRRFLFSSVNDVRVMIIRLSDKLYDGLTVDGISNKKQIEYAKRVVGLYSPISEYVGLHYFKRKFDDISFRILYPVEAKKMESFLEEGKNNELKALAKVKLEIKNILKINNINNYEIQGRIKSLYSTYLKYKNKGEDRLKDRVGIRILCKSVADCYNILGLLHAKYKYLPDEFNDYISSPKANGYRSLQTTLNFENRTTLEVQVRTFEMHDFNEFGPASHVAYKISQSGEGGKGFEWLKDLIQWQKIDNKNAYNYKINVLDNFVYVFTPKGDTIQLPKGATALDFAYRIHTDIGDRCMGVKINHKMSKINTILNNGDEIEILTNNKLNVSKNWLEAVNTHWAKEHIRKITAIQDPVI